MNYTIKTLHAFIKQALLEDVGDGDHTSLSTIPAGKESKAQLIIKEEGVLAGLTIAKHIFYFIDKNLIVDTFMKDGDFVKPGDRILEVSGSVHSILIAERLVLNIMQRMSGIASITAKIILRLKGTHTQVLDTRKTTPGIRFLEKEAVKIGGGVNHRFGLYDMILIKDNHVDYSGGINKALDNANQYLKTTGRNLKIELETRNLEEVKQAIAHGGLQRIMFDNFEPLTMVKAVELVAGKFETEASGGITIENARIYAETGVDYLSMGVLTHSVKSLDISLKAF